jgi:hypothetical protein
MVTMKNPKNINTRDTMNKKREFTPSAAVAVTGDSPIYFYHLLQRGAVKATKCGRRWLIPAAEVEKRRAERVRLQRAAGVEDVN